MEMILLGCQIAGVQEFELSKFLDTPKENMDGWSPTKVELL